MLKIAAVRCPWLNVDVIGQVERLLCRKGQVKSVGFHEKIQKVDAFWLKVRETFVKKSV